VIYSRGEAVLFSVAGERSMIKLLRINNIALIAASELEFGPGLNLLTGETGAGKSILIDALGLLLGDRASADLIRTGESQAVVEGMVESRKGAELLELHGLPREGDEIVLRREVNTSGKGKATVNGALVPLALFRELGERLVAVHGQHEPQGLLDPDTHLAVVDAHAGLAQDTAALREPFRLLREVQAALDALRLGARESERRREMLEFQAAEIEKADLSSGEEEALRQEKVVQANAGRLATLSQEAYAGLFEDEGAVLTRLGTIYRRVEELAAIDPRFLPFAEARKAIAAQLEDLALFLRDYAEGLQVSPGRLDEIESRLALIDRLKRKYGATVDEILAFGERCRRELQADGSLEEREKDLETERARAAEAYLEKARALSERRRKEAPPFERKVEAELALLAMERTRFQVRFEPEVVSTDSSTWTERGLERAEFLLSPNPGEELRPLARIASGGELSRILLALESVANLGASGKTLVFDEVDAGIGGRVAEVVGRKLRAIASHQQVLCVTHLHQIASLAETHHAVEKRVDRGRTRAEVRLLSSEDRVDEIARMLGGETITETTRRHAREMIKQGLRP
jgi:DNA repair protein RecN (Recombination protein N)